MASSRFAVLILSLSALLLGGCPASGFAVGFLFDATKAETAGNADWVVDEDSAVAPRYPTPPASGLTASTPETYWTGALSSWGVALVQLGHAVETLPVGGRITYLDATNAQDLSRYQVYVVCEPNILFTAAERTAIARFVQEGGSLFVISDHVGSDRNNDGYDSVAIWNDFFANNGVQANPFGVTINQTNVSVVSTQADPAADDPLTHGPQGVANTLKYSNGATFTLNTAANSTVRAAFWSAATHANNNVMAAYGSFGAGRFAVLGDSSPVDDGTGGAGHTLYSGWTEEGVNHSRLVLNASLWLAAARNNGAPYNDNFANAVRLDATATAAVGTNVNASREPGEPVHAGRAGGASVWWQFTPANGGPAALSTPGSDFDTLLAVYTGDRVDALTPVAANDNAGGGVTYSAASFPVTAGTTYRVAVDGVNGATGRVNLGLTQPAPPNDAFANAAPVNFSGAALTLTGNNFNATAEFGEPSHAGYAGGRSVWWRWTAAATGYVTVSTVGSDFDTLLAVYTGASVNALTAVAGNANYGSLLQSQTSFNAQAGATYSFAVDGYAGAAGHVTLTVSPGSQNAPVNDNFINATAVSGASVRVTATNTSATAEPGEPTHGSTDPNHSVWWRWNAPSDGFVQAYTASSAVPTALGVYVGGSVSTLTRLAGVSSATSSSVATTVRVLADTTYFFAVDGSTSATGKVYLNLAFTATPPVPPNDNFANAAVLSGTSVSGNGSNANGTLEPGEPAPRYGANGGRTIWWRWTAPSDLVVTLSTYNSSIVPVVEVFTGSALNALQSVAATSSPTVSFGVRAGVTYWLRVDADPNGQVGLISLALSSEATPTVTIAATTPQTTEGAVAMPGVVTVSLDHTVSVPTTVYFTLGGTAINETDYTLRYSGTYSNYGVTVQPNNLRATVSVYGYGDDDPTEGDETVTFSLTPGTFYNLASPANATVTIRDNSPYSSAWAGAYRPSGFSGALAAPVADPDGDGISNLLEWAFNLNPLAADGPAALPTVGTGLYPDPQDGNSTPRHFLTLTFLRRTDAPNLSYAVEASTDPAANNWDPSTAIVVSTDATNASPNMQRIVYRSPAPLDGPNAVPRQFLRVRVTASTP